jgi:hypothetical protein
MNVKKSKVGWGFWLQWALASAVGMFVGFSLGFLVTDSIPDVLGRWFGFSVFGIVLGVAVGILQWFILRRYLSVAGWWVLASAVGGLGIFQAGLIFGFSTFFGPYESLVAFLGWIGIASLGWLVTGTLQWLVLRGKVSRAGWWVLASTVGWALSATVTRTIPWGVEPKDALWALVVAGVVWGMVTGGALVWLLRQPVPEA